MRVVAIGVGGAGGRIVDALRRDDESRSASYLAGVRALDTDRAALSDLEAVPEEARHLFGQVETGGNGTAGNRARAAAAVEADLVETRRAVDPAVSSDAAAIVLVAGLGGGTGGVATPELAESLREVYDRPVYAVSVLPAAHEEVPAENAARGLQSLHGAVDAQLVFDNDAWLGSDESIADAAAELNRTLAERLGALFGAGEAATADSVGQRVVDASEVIATLEAGGLATIGYARQAVGDEGASDDDSLLGRVRGLVSSTEESVDEVTAIKAVETTLRRAANGRLTFDCPLDAATSGLLVVAGPPDWLNQSAISDGQNWLSEEMGSVQLRTGDDPVPGGDELAVLVVLAGIRDAPRIDELRTTDV
ncbi:tubulin/FtsZ family protein [Halorussus halobius]|uniref:tubulin/FtsZ family protein n=1 Tax=Halorussus halobius TaxID=1710537 RepID=UPI001091CF9B|nr:tubulin/FtsZ family protein [Halorussus halobius]